MVPINTKGQALLAVALMVSGLLAACSGQSTKANGSSADGSVYERLITLDGFDRRQMFMAEQEAAAVCMARQGFDYIAYYPAGSDDSELPIETLAELPPAGYAEEHGFGLADQLENQKRAVDDDPNIPVVEALNPSDQAAYRDALYGHAEGGAPPQGGCLQPPNEQYLNVTIQSRDLRIEARERLLADPEYVELEGDWSRCMATHGYDLQNRHTSILEYFAPQMEALFAEWDVAGVVALRHAEIEVALVDVECLDAIDAKLRDLAARHEQRLLDEAFDVLDIMGQLQLQYDASE